MTTSCRESSSKEAGDIKEAGASKEAGARRRLGHLRSMSTPDIKVYSGPEVANPYVSLEKLLDHEDGSSSSSCSSSSSSSSSHELLGGDQLFRRPVRDTALRRGRGRGAEEKEKLEEGEKEEHYEGEMERKEEGERERVARKLPDCSYMRRQQEEVRVNCQPQGFDAR